MLNEDYIMRMNYQALAVLMITLKLMRAGQFSEALQTYNQAIENLLGLNPRLDNQLLDNLLLDMHAFQGKLDVDRLLLQVDGYCEEANMYSLPCEDSLNAASLLPSADCTSTWKQPGQARLIPTWSSLIDQDTMR